MFVLDPIEPSGIVKSRVDNQAVNERKIWHDGIRAHLFGTGFEPLVVCASHSDLRSPFIAKES
jgi:hypothetical protein